MPKLDLSGLHTAVSEDADVNSSALTLIRRLLDDIAAANAESQAAVNEVVATYRAQTGQFAADIVAHTPAA